MVEELVCATRRVLIGAYGVTLLAIVILASIVFLGMYIEVYFLALLVALVFGGYLVLLDACFRDAIMNEVHHWQHAHGVAGAALAHITHTHSQHWSTHLLCSMPFDENAAWRLEHHNVDWQFPRLHQSVLYVNGLVRVLSAGVVGLYIVWCGFGIKPSNPDEFWSALGVLVGGLLLVLVLFVALSVTLFWSPTSYVYAERAAP